MSSEKSTVDIVVRQYVNVAFGDKAERLATQKPVHTPGVAQNHLPAAPGYGRSQECGDFYITFVRKTAGKLYRIRIGKRRNIISLYQFVELYFEQ